MDEERNECVATSECSGKSVVHDLVAQNNS